MTGFAPVWPLRRRSLPALALSGPRVTLTPPCLVDWREWRAVRGRNRDYLKPFEPAWPDSCLTRGFFARRLKRQREDWTLNLARYFLIRRNDTGVLIGGVNINHLCFGAARHGDLGYWLDEAHQGHGYMAEAIYCVLRYGFDELGLMRMQAACIPENDRSMRLLRRLGFAEEGFARSYIQIDGAWRDHHLFALTRAEYLRMTGVGR